MLLGMDGTRRVLATHAATGEATQDLAVPPVDLPKAQHAFWQASAPHAIEQRTLTPATVVGFRELCEQWTLKHDIAAAILKTGAATSGAEGLLRTYVKLAQRLDATLARFKLTAFGKPADGAGVKKPVANPWAAIATR